MSTAQHYLGAAHPAASLPEQQQQHEAAGPALAAEADVDITFTATTSASGTLLLGSSREFSGWSDAPSASIASSIMRRAVQFLPHLAGAPTPEGPAVRVGLRPFAVGGLPMIGPIPECPGGSRVV